MSFFTDWFARLSPVDILSLIGIIGILIISRISVVGYLLKFNRKKKRKQKNSTSTPTGEFSGEMKSVSDDTEGTKT